MKRREPDAPPEDVVTGKKFRHWRWHQFESVLVLGCPICEGQEHRSPTGWRWVDEKTIRPFIDVGPGGRSR